MKNCYSWYRYSDSIVYLPTPMDLPLEEECMKMSYDNGYDIVKLFLSGFPLKALRNSMGGWMMNMYKLMRKQKGFRLPGMMCIHIRQ